MMSELRWTLLIIGVLFIVALAWWERRRPRQASGNFERSPVREHADAPPSRAVREPPLTLPEVHAGEPLGSHALPVVELEELATAQPEGLLSAASATAAIEAPAAPEEARIEDDASAAPPSAQEEADTDSRPPAAPPLPREVLPELPAAAPPLVDWPPDEERRILALRLVAPLAERFAGRSLRQALAAEGFVLGQFAIFHKPDEERRAVLSAASLTRPGTFDMQTMDSQHYGGLSLFAVLPGPKSPPQAFEELVFTARNLNERLHGVLQDERGSPLTPARIAQLREQLGDGMAS
jgi:cell division protein ZipA